ncbi:hypothetical protein Tco_1271150, partial [Tanacetum coccineum]
GKSSALKGFFVDADRVGGNYPTGNIESSVVDIGPMDMSESMQEALHRSNLEVSGAEYVRKEVPLHVLPTLSLFNLESSMTTFTDLQSVLYEEERIHVCSFVLSACISASTAVYNAGTGKSIRFLTFIILQPIKLPFANKWSTAQVAINTLQDRVKENEIQSVLLHL